MLYFVFLGVFFVQLLWLVVDQSPVWSSWYVESFAVVELVWSEWLELFGFGYDHRFLGFDHLSPVSRRSGRIELAALEVFITQKSKKGSLLQKRCF